MWNWNLPQLSPRNLISLFCSRCCLWGRAVTWVMKKVFSTYVTFQEKTKCWERDSEVMVCYVSLLGVGNSKAGKAPAEAQEAYPHRFMGFHLVSSHCQTFFSKPLKPWTSAEFKLSNKSENTKPSNLFVDQRLSLGWAGMFRKSYEYVLIFYLIILYE